MVEIVLRTDVEKNKIEALLHFFRSWNIDAEVKGNSGNTTKKKIGFSLSSGIWKDHTINTAELRKQAWDMNK